MTNLSDFLKTQKMRCVKAYGDCLTVGKEYSVLNIRMEVEVRDDEGGRYYWESDHFEPVVDDMPKSAEKPLQDMKLTPEFEAAETVLADNGVNTQDIGTNILDTNADIKDTPKFKVGDKVYVGLTGKIARVTKIIDDDVVNVANKNNEVRAWVSNICHATQENYEMLCKLYPHIKFERPPLTGSDLARAMVDKGWFIVDCYVSAISDEDALRFRNKRMQVALFGDGLFTDGVKQFPFAVPFDSRTGEPLTESILND